MEITKVETVEFEKATQQQAVNEIRELSELQLALVGGGIADVVIA